MLIVSAELGLFSGEAATFFCRQRKWWGYFLLFWYQVVSKIKITDYLIQPNESAMRR